MKENTWFIKQNQTNSKFLSVTWQTIACLCTIVLGEESHESTLDPWKAGLECRVVTAAAHESQQPHAARLAHMRICAHDIHVQQGGHIPLYLIL